MSTDNIPPVPGTGKPWLTPNFPAIPEEIRELHQCVLFRIEGEDKVPYSPNGKHASTKNSKTWSTFDEVTAAYDNGGFDGVGFVFTAEDPYAGVDLDDCRDPATGEVTPEAQEIIAKLASYAEISVSGTGVHLILRGHVPSGRKMGWIEMYDRAGSSR